MLVPRTRLTAVGSRAFSVLGPSTWNDLALPLRQKPSLDSFRCNSKHFFSPNYGPAMFSLPCCCRHPSQVCLLPVLKGLAHSELAKNNNFWQEILSYVRLLCSINFCFGPFEMRQFKNNQQSKHRLDNPHPQPHPHCSYLWNAYYVITFCCFTHVFVDSAYKQLAMALSQAPQS